MSGSATGLSGILVALANVQRSAASGSLIARGEGGGVLVFEKGRLSRVLRGEFLSDAGDGAAPDPAVMRSGARDLLRAWASSRAEVGFSAGGAANPPSPGADGNVNVGDLILDLVRASAGISWLKQEMGSLPEKLSANPSPRAVVPRIALTEADGFLMSRVDGSLSLSEIVSLSPLPEEETVKALYGLVAAGILVAAGSETAAGPKPKISALDDFLKRTSGPDSEPSSKASSDAREATAPTPVNDPERTEILTRIQECGGADHYKVLGVEKTADEGQVRRAYYKLAKHFHPDRYHKPGFEDIVEEIERMFAQTTEAYNTLTDERSRSEYDRHLAEQASGVKTPELDRVHAARESYARAKKHLETNELYDALRLFETACEKDPSRHEYFFYLGLVQTRNPKWRKRAEQNFLKAIEMSPTSTQAYLQLARLYKAGGLARKSAEMYEKLLAWEPDHQEALVELGRAKPAAAEAQGRIRSMFKGSKS